LGAISKVMALPPISPVIAVIVSTPPAPVVTVGVHTY
jgi:hypothetical protein